MKLDADKLAAEVKAHRVRMESPLWAPSDRETDEDWISALNISADDSGQSSSRVWEDASSSQTQATAREIVPDVAVQELLPRLEALDRTVERLTNAAYNRQSGTDGLPAWAASAAGNPHSYDAPDADRTGVCVRILPTTYAQIQQIQSRMGLRTTAGAWEFLLRLGLAAAERLPAR